MEILRIVLSSVCRRVSVSLMAIGLLPLASLPVPALEPEPSARIQFRTRDQVTWVAVETRGQAQYHALGRLRNPDRLYFDLLGAKFGGIGNREESILVGSKLLKRIRVAQKSPGITRVVLDLENPVEAVTSRAANPDRVMIELRPVTRAISPWLVVTQRKVETASAGADRQKPVSAGGSGIAGILPAAMAAPGQDGIRTEPDSATRARAKKR